MPATPRACLLPLLAACAACAEPSPCEGWAGYWTGELTSGSAALLLSVSLVEHPLYGERWGPLVVGPWLLGLEVEWADLDAPAEVEALPGRRAATFTYLDEADCAEGAPVALDLAATHELAAARVSLDAALETATREPGALTLAGDWAVLVEESEALAAEPCGAPWCEALREGWSSETAMKRLNP